jgi:hypothetical protein
MVSSSNPRTSSKDCKTNKYSHLSRRRTCTQRHQRDSLFSLQEIFKFSFYEWRSSNEMEAAVSCANKYKLSKKLIKLDSVYLQERPPLWYSGQSSWLQIQRSGFDSRRYQIFSEK